jgi:AraC-like DNA-binding protein
MYEIWRQRFGFKYERQSHPVIASRYEYQDSFRQAWHSHEQAQFVYALKGILRVITPVGVWTLPPLHGLWLIPGISHELHAIGKVSMRSVYFEPDIVPRDELVCRVLAVSSLMRELVESMIADKEAGHKRRASLLDPLLLKEMRDAVEVFEGLLPLPQDRRLQQICEMLIGNPGQDDALGVWGERVGASERTLARLFRDETGLTFGQWRQQLRIVEAVARLALDVPVKAIAAELGYQSAGAFVTMFKKVMGTPPQGYLTASRNGQQRVNVKE